MSDKTFNASISLRRSTLNEQTALTFAQYFDKAIEERVSVFIPAADFPKCNVNTLYKKVSDAFLYLRRNSKNEEKRVQYIVLKSRIRLAVRTEPVRGIVIEQLDGNCQPYPLFELNAAQRKIVKDALQHIGEEAQPERVNAPVAMPTSTNNMTWKERFILALTTDVKLKDGVFEDSKVNLKTEDIAWVMTECAKYNFPCRVEQNLIRFFKIIR
jgi:hypothetical protein